MKPTFRPLVEPRLLLDDDGHNVFSTLSEDYRKDIEEAVAECPPKVTTYLLCCGAGKFYYPTKVAAVDPRCKQLVAEHARGNDPFGYFLQRLKAAGKETCVSFRMNDVHNPEDADEWNLPLVRKQHPDCIVGRAAVERGDPDWFNFGLDYSHPAVPPHFLKIFAELLENYPMDGLQLDWMRFPCHLSGTPEEVWAKREHLTNFVATIREMTNARGVKLFVRVPSSLAGCRVLGTDVVAWVLGGLVDAVTMAPFLTSDFFMPIQEMRAAMGHPAVPIYATIECQHGFQYHNAESVRAVATGLYESGADGISMFNFPTQGRHFNQDVYASAVEGIEHPATACRKPLLFSVAHRRVRKEMDLPGILPVTLEIGEAKTIALRVPAAALPAWRARLLVQTSGNCGVALNGVEVEAFQRPRAPELFLEYTFDATQPAGLARPTREESRSFRLPADLLQAGDNQLVLRNAGDTFLHVLRINLGLW
ncbi:MAG: hypothetical protein K9M98_02760 [Cephaloticoccus sp.]|nr:hypothetical protein [Akkermansiaceae bacterium]MCF7759402.1 hypothetical protein [Cephaloticoccus sp.]